MRVKKVLAVAALAAAACTAHAAGASAATPFYAIDHQRIATPPGVQPWLPTYTADGRAIVFQNQLDGTTWTVPAKGGKARCITCGFDDRPQIRGGFTYAFPDGERLLLTHELGGSQGVDSGPDADAWVLECAPSIGDCRRHTYLPVDMSQDKGTKYIVQRRTWHLAPDGRHLGWSEIRLDGMIMVVARLERRDGKYVATDQRVVNPAGPTGPGDRDPQRWENANQLYELKSFTDGGRAILAVAQRSFNVDVLKIDLATGRTTRVTNGPDWDEDGGMSPDGAHEVLYSWRTRRRVEALGMIPQLRGFTAMPMAAAVLPYYVSTWPGFQCDLAPWLLPGSGDDGGALVGQPLNVYGGGLVPGNNLSGEAFWSPDSTSVLLQERRTQAPPASASEHVGQKGLVPNRVLVARIRRAAGRRAEVHATKVGAWAKTPTTYSGTTDSNQTVTLPGKRGGSVTLVYQGSLAAGSWSQTYAGYSEDGRTFVDGTVSVARTRAGVWTIHADARVRGAHTGALTGDVTIAGPAEEGGLPVKTGNLKATYDGRTSAPLPALGACPDDLPKRTAVTVRARQVGGRVAVRVTAAIAGDRRPVAGAVVRLGARRARTDARGRAVLASGGGSEVRVDAGDTFLPGRARVR